MPELLCLGQADDSATPALPAAKIFFKSSNGYGASAGTNDVLLLFETQDFAPMGPLGRCVARRVYLNIEYGGSITLRVTPIADFAAFTTAQDFNLAAPVGGRKRATIEIPMAKPLTWLRVRVEMISRDGLFWLHGVKLAHRPLTGTYEQIAGPDA